MRRNLKVNILFPLLVAGCFASCKKYLDEKPVKNVTNIARLEDLQALLDNDELTRSFMPTTTMAADEFVLNAQSFSALPREERDVYTWNSQAYFDAWTYSYRGIYYANVVLDELERIKGGTAAVRNYIKGQALFRRAFSIYELAQVYCLPYAPGTASEPGIVLRTSPDVEQQFGRSTVKETYDFMIRDLKEAETLLSEENDILSRPNKISVYGLLSRVYHAMGDYAGSLTYAGMYLQRRNQLMDFNAVDTTKNPSFARQNTETNYYATCNIQIVYMQPAVNPELYALYADNDLRRSVYFMNASNGNRTFKGSYAGNNGYRPFIGISTNEIYLNSAEAKVRLGQVEEGLEDLNTLLITRWKTGSYTPVASLSKEEALVKILVERRKELVYRGTRWTDIRRLNAAGGNITLSRELDGSIYTLPPNDKRYAWLIPLNVIQLSGIPQNSR